MAVVSIPPGQHAATCLLGTTFHSYTYVQHLLADTCVFHYYKLWRVTKSLHMLLQYAHFHETCTLHLLCYKNWPIQQLTPTLLSSGLHTLLHGEEYSFLRPVFSVASILGHYLLTGKTWASTPSGVDGSKGRENMNQTGSV